MVTHVSDNQFLMLCIQENTRWISNAGLRTFDDADRRSIAGIIGPKNKNRIANIIRHEKLAVFFIEEHLRGPIQLSGLAFDDAQWRNITDAVERINGNR